MADDRVTIVLGIPGVNDRVLAELRGVAVQLGLPLEEALALLVGLGTAEAYRQGLIRGRVLKPMSRVELLRELAEMIEEADDG